MKNRFLLIAQTIIVIHKANRWAKDYAKKKKAEKQMKEDSKLFLQDLIYLFYNFSFVGKFLKNREPCSILKVSIGSNFTVSQQKGELTPN